MAQENKKPIPTDPLNDQQIVDEITALLDASNSDLGGVIAGIMKSCEKFFDEYQKACKEKDARKYSILLTHSIGFADYVKAREADINNIQDSVLKQIREVAARRSNLIIASNLTDIKKKP